MSSMYSFNGRLRFRGVDFRYNPKSLSMKRERKLVRFASPIAGSFVQNVGEQPLVVSGTGELCGNTAAQDYRAISALFELDGSGLLQIPGQSPVQVWFASLGLLRQAEADLWTYEFTFVEDCNGSGRAVLKQT